VHNRLSNVPDAEERSRRIRLSKRVSLKRSPDQKENLNLEIKVLRELKDRYESIVKDGASKRATTILSPRASMPVIDQSPKT